MKKDKKQLIIDGDLFKSRNTKLVLTLKPQDIIPEVFEIEIWWGDKKYATWFTWDEEKKKKIKEFINTIAK